LRLAQDGESKLRLEQLTGLPVTVTGNLKFDAPALRDDPELREALARRIGERPFWLAASTQKGEEALLRPAIEDLTRRHPDLLTIIVPRHPERGEDVAALFPAGIRRSLGQTLDSASPVYIADTLGELGIFYRLAPIVFMGGSLVPHGGQNPIEAARLGAAVTIGPHHWNQADAVAALKLPIVSDAADLARLIDRWLSVPESLHDIRRANSEHAASLGPVLPKVMEALSTILPPDQANG
jgi:3-deoxy-D-manno-octulosonic-acid transferase